jgi:hypothetical protein
MIGITTWRGFLDELEEGDGMLRCGRKMEEVIAPQVWSTPPLAFLPSLGHVKIKSN